MGGDEVTLRFVRHDDVERYLRAGWMITNDLADSCHGEFAVLMLQPCDCPKPQRGQAGAP
jgi:hypothetical protein